MAKCSLKRIRTHFSGLNHGSITHHVLEGGINHLTSLIDARGKTYIKDREKCSFQ